MKIHYTRGDATAPRCNEEQASSAAIIAHICNDVGGWGKGFVTAISNRWPEPEREYRQWYAEREGNDFGLGQIQVVPVEEDLLVANMVAQHGLRPKDGIAPIRYDALEQCLDALGAHAWKLSATTVEKSGGDSSAPASVHMPRIGCGLAGGEWDQVELLIQRTLIRVGVPVTVYDF
jgi:O-acetyl-ADP-ribose deacetylase (regulator of RNase III)